MKTLWILPLGILLCTSALAEQNIVNNYGTAPAPQPQTPPPSSGCQSNQQDSSSGPPEGTYSYSNNTTAGTIVTTGEKKPYMVDNSCNNPAPVIQPYVYAQPGGPGPMPAPAAPAPAR